MQLKTCKKCGETKAIFDFPKARIRNDGSFNYRPSCKVCTVKENLDKYHNGGGKEKQKERSFKNNLKKYGMSVDDYWKMHKEQEGKCKICKTNKVSVKKANYNLFVDHDHKSGKVRGLLCHHCNCGLGHFKDDVELLKNSIEYLNDNRS